MGDADLTRPAGEPLLLEMNFLNAEIDLFEEILAHNIKRIGEYKVFDPDPAERPTTANVNMKRMPLKDEQTGKAWLHTAAIPLAESKGRSFSSPISMGRLSGSRRRWPITTW